MSKSINVKVTERYSKRVLAEVTLVEQENHWTDEGSAYDVMLGDKRIGEVESYRSAKMYSIANSRLGQPGVERKWWTGRTNTLVRVQPDGTSSRMDVLRDLLVMHERFEAKVAAPLTDGHREVLADIAEKGHSRRYGSSEHVIPVLTAKGLVTRLSQPEENEDGTRRVFAVTDAGRAELA